MYGQPAFEEHNRLGCILPGSGGNDRWWRVASDVDLDQLASELVELIRDHAIPWLWATEARMTDDLAGP